MQLAVVEFARSILGWSDAQSSEFDPSTTHPVVIEMPEHNPGDMGATMRLGKRKTVFKTTDSLLSEFHSSMLKTYYLKYKDTVHIALHSVYKAQLSNFKY